VVGLDLRAGPRLQRSPEAAKSDGRLSRGYWLAWAFLVAAVAVEFSIVFWGATLIGRRTGVDTAAATLLGGMFVGGMFVGRLAQSLGLGTHGGVRRPAGIGIVLAAIGASIAWVSTIPVLSGAGLFVAGLGVAGLYPLGVAAALGAAPGQLAHAGTRLTLASGTAILAAPLALGVVADAAGVVVGWGLVVGLAVVALVLATTLPESAPADGDAAGFDDAGSVGPLILGPG
jgi:MFS family permease